MIVVDTRTLLSHSWANLARTGRSERDCNVGANRSLAGRIADRLAEARRSRALLLVEQLSGRGQGLDGLILHQVGAASFHR